MTMFQDSVIPKQVMSAHPRHQVGSDTWMDDYREFGFVVFERLIPEALVSSHLERFEELLARFNVRERGAIEQLKGVEREQFDVALDGLYSDPEQSLELCRYPVMHALATKLFREDSVAWNPLTMIWGGGAIPHRDLICFRDPSSEAARLWVAMEDLHPESGLLYVVPGSQKSGYRYNELLDEEPEFLEILRLLAKGGTGVESWNKLMKPIIDHHHEESALIAESSQKEILDLKMGDAVLFDAALIHGSLVSGDRGLTRKSFLLELRSRSCKTYSMRAYFGSKHDYRRPENAVSEMIIESPLGPYGRRVAVDKDVLSAPIVGFSESA